MEKMIRVMPLFFLFLQSCGVVGDSVLDDSNLCELDSAFMTQISSGFTGTVSDIEIQEDSKILVAGSFTKFLGENATGLVRLNEDGTLDTVFLSVVKPNDSVFAIEITSEGNILLGGRFTSISGVSSNHLAQIDEEGVLDLSFRGQLGTGPNAFVSEIKADSQKRVLIGGEFTSVNSLNAGHFARLGSDGAVDTTFLSQLGAGFNLAVDEILFLAGDQMLLGGSFTTFQGLGPSRLLRISDAAVYNQSFNHSLGLGFNAGVRAVLEHRSSGRIFIGGSFETRDAQQGPAYLQVLASDGTADIDFHAAMPKSKINDDVHALVLKEDASLYVGGAFSGALLRLESTGEEDTSFTQMCGSGFDGPVRVIRKLDDGSLLLGGDFRTFKESSAPGIAKLK